jgi:hypothetical protein
MRKNKINGFFQGVLRICKEFRQHRGGLSLPPPEKALPEMDHVDFGRATCEIRETDLLFLRMRPMPSSARFSCLLCLSLALQASPPFAAGAGEDDMFPTARRAGGSGIETSAPVPADGDSFATPGEPERGAGTSITTGEIVEATIGPSGSDVEPLPMIGRTLAAFGGRDFLTMRAEIAGSLPSTSADASRDVVARVEAALRLAALHLHHGLWREAASIARSAEAMASVSGVEAPLRERDALMSESRRIQAMSIVADPLSRNPASSLEGFSEHEGHWPEFPLLRAAALAREGRFDDVEAPVTPQAILLGGLSDQLLAALGPHLLEAAIHAGDASASEFLFAVVPWTEERLASSRLWLEGLAAERADDLAAAVDLYAKASEGRDVWSQRARIRMIRLGLEAGTLGEEEARETLRLARLQWRGDALALEVLRMAADLEISRSDEVEAISILEEIRMRHADIVDIPAHDAETWDLVSRHYGEEMTLAQLLEGHSRLALHFSGRAPFLPHAEGAADLFLAGGAVQMAADEYARIVSAYERLSRGRRLGAGDKSAFLAEADRVRIKSAGALLASGRAAEALETLPADPPEGELGDQAALVRAEALTLTGDLDGVIETRTSRPDADHLRLLAAAHAGLGDWTAAHRTWMEALDALVEGGRAVEARDLHAFALASARSGRIEGDMPLLRRLAEDLPEAARTDLAERIAAAFRVPEPLMREDLEEGIERASMTASAASGTFRPDYMD